jgi:hypothetical protein
MIALLSGAWWAQKLTGVTAKALGAALAVAVAVCLVVGGLWWLRHDARRDERTGWAVRLSHARLQDVTKAAARQRAAEAIGRARNEEYVTALVTSEAARVELEQKLAALKANPVCWPKGLVGDLNR